MLIMKKFYSTSLIDTLQAIGIIAGFYAFMAIIALLAN
jgi:hypothetical protein